MSTITIDPPARLPVDYLSLSSLRQFMRCPEAWRRRYIEKILEPPSGKMVLGGAAGAALAQHYGHQLESGVGLSTEALLDEFCSEWDDRIHREEVNWGSDSAGALKDGGVGTLHLYHKFVANHPAVVKNGRTITEATPAIFPVSVEREFQLSWPGVQWCLTGFIDLEDADGLVRDYKATARKLPQRDADADLQPTVYLAARRAEGNPATGFRFDTLIRTQQPKIEVVKTDRSDADLDRLTNRIFTLAREIEWRAETDTWSGAAPGTWFCSTCRYHDCALRLGRL